MGGQEKYHSLAPMYYRGAAAAILVYDMTKRSSFEKLQKWVDELKERGPEGIVLCVAANKCDLERSRGGGRGRGRICASIGSGLLRDVGEERRERGTDLHDAGHERPAQECCGAARGRG